MDPCPYFGDSQKVPLILGNSYIMDKTFCFCFFFHWAPADANVRLLLLHFYRSTCVPRSQMYFCELRYGLMSICGSFPK